MNAEVLCRAADLAATHGPDIEEALRLWDDAGASRGGVHAQAWLSVAFLFSRHHRTAETLFSN
jgi:hypothetical protein